MQRREEQLRREASRVLAWNQICSIVQIAAVIGLLCACMATFVVIFANIFPASMGLTPQKPHSLKIDKPDVPVYEALARIHVDDPFLTPNDDAARPSADLEEEILMSNFITPLHPNVGIMCMLPFLDSSREIAFSTGHVEPGVEIGERAKEIMGPQSEPQASQETFISQCKAIASLQWDTTTCSKHGEFVSLSLPGTSPGVHQPVPMPVAQIEDVPETASRLNSLDFLSSNSGAVILALPLPQPPQMFTGLIALPTQEIAAPQTASITLMQSAAPISRNEDQSTDMQDACIAFSLLPEEYTSVATVARSSSHEKTPASLPDTSVGSDFSTAVTLAPANEQLSESETSMDLEAFPTFPPEMKLPVKFSQEALDILRGIWQHSFCLPADHDPIMEQRLMGVKSITMPRPSLMRAVVGALGAVLSYQVSCGVHVSTHIVTQISAAMQHEQVVHTVAWVILLSVMIVTSYVLLSTEGVPVEHLSPDGQQAGSQMGADFQFQQAVPPGGHGSPVHQPGQLFPAGSAERDASGSPIATAVTSTSQERRVTPQPIAAAASVQSCHDSIVEGGAQSDSVHGSVGELGVLAEAPVSKHHPDEREPDQVPFLPGKLLFCCQCPAHRSICTCDAALRTIDEQGVFAVLYRGDTGGQGPRFHGSLGAASERTIAEAAAQRAEQCGQGRTDC